LCWGRGPSCHRRAGSHGAGRPRLAVCRGPLPEPCGDRMLRVAVSLERFQSRRHLRQRVEKEVHVFPFSEQHCHFFGDGVHDLTRHLRHASTRRTRGLW
ncbi:unnamed protein product, partial [Ectocarpus fasciculatus]